jgi:hypothetical protein
MSKPIRNVRYTDDTLITDARITEVPRSGQTASGYGGKIPTRYQIRYNNSWHRVYMMQYGNAGTAFICVRGEDLVLSTHAEHLVESLAEGGRSTDPQRGKP